MKGARFVTLNDLPLFAADDQIGEVVLGPERKTEFEGFATLLERDGMPKISPLWGGRYVPAVKAFLDHDNGLFAQPPMAPRGVEGVWETGRTSRRRG